MTDCPFCQRLASGDMSEANAYAVAFADAYPVAAVRARALGAAGAGGVLGAPGRLTPHNVMTS